MNRLPLTPVQFHRLGLTVIHQIQELPSDFKSTTHAIKYHRFRQLFGVDPETCTQVLRDIQHIAPAEHRISKPDESLLLMSLEWLRTYKAFTELQGLYAIKSDKTIRKWLRAYIQAIQALKNAKIILRRDDGAIESRTVDCLHIPICEPRTKPSATFCSPKTKHPALSYEICLIARRQQVAWVNGPFPAGTTDIRIFRAPGGLKSQLREGEYLFADQGYRGEPEILRVRNPRDTDAVKEAKRRSLARQESFNARLKSFKILSQPFRGKHAHDGITCHDNHKTIVEAIVVLLQYEMENGHLLLPV
jgi:DDE superfamily endonuclease